MQQLDALGGEEQRLGPCLQGGSALMLQHKAVQDRAEGGLVRAHGDDVMSLLAQRAGQRRNLGALARAVKSFERDEETAPRAHVTHYSPVAGPLARTAHSDDFSMTSLRLGSSPVLRAVSACSSTS